MKILPFGVAVIEGDTHISKWVEQHGKLNIAEQYLRPFKQYVWAGSLVVDAGAMIGDHTATYAEWVGPEGTVFAFEPNPIAYECLLHNTKDMPQVLAVDMGLSDSVSTCSIQQSDNVGASHLSGSDGSVNLRTLDCFNIAGNRFSFFKIDVEGYETRVLRGAKKTIEANKPVMLIEVNEGALVRAGTSRNELLSLIGEIGYTFSITDKRAKLEDPQYDVLCLPMKGFHESS